MPPKTPIGEGVAINDGVRLLAVGAIMAVAAWATDSIAWGLVLGLGVAILYGVLQYRQFLRWSERPLTRPGTPVADGGFRHIDLERMGDEAEKIARMAAKISHLPLPTDQYASVQRMQESVIRMVASTRDAYARLDLEAARSVIRADAQVDRMFADIDESRSRGLHMRAESVLRALNTIWTARALERIGDHAKNICEHIVYLIEGTDVRHMKPLVRGHASARE